MDKEDVLKYSKNLDVLYVEDSRTLRNLIQKKLLPLFKHLDTAEDGEKALEAFVDFREKNSKFYDIVISDLEMPNMDGKALSKAVLDFNAAQNIIIISANEDLRYDIELINLGIHKFLAKPIEEAQLYQTIYEVSQSIRLKRLKQEETLETEEYNRILKKREEAHLEDMQKYVKELEEFQKAVYQSSIVSKTDPNGRITYVNDQFCKTTGYTQEELIGKTHRLVNSGHLSRAFYTKLWNTIKAKKPYKILFKNKAKDGSIFYIESVITPILDTDDEIKEFLAIAYDVTTLIESVESMKKMQEDKESFFINISHEMRTPLNAITGLTPLLQKQVKDNEKASMIVNTIHQSGHDLSNLIESVLSLNRLRTGTLTLIESAFSPKDVLEKCIARHIEKSLIKNQVFNSFIDTELPDSLTGDAARIVQFLNILFDNAIKFTPEGGTIDVNISYDFSDERLICEIKDSGVGISKEDQEKIFKLQQVNASFTRTHEGAGLGLSIVFELLKLMGGEISLESTLDEGSLFTVQVPLKQAV